MERSSTRRPFAEVPSRTWWVALVVVAVVALVVGSGIFVAACGGTTAGRATSSTETTAAGAKAAIATTAGEPLVAATTGSASTSATTTPTVTAQDEASPAESVAKILGPSVVNIKVTGTTIAGNGFGFGQRQQQYSAEGSGVIYRSDGMILTNNHVVTDQYTGNPVSTIKVTLATGEQLDGTIVGRDPLTEIAVIKVKPTRPLPAAEFIGKVPMVGGYAIAIGSPLGYENSVTLGIISGVSRDIEGVTGREAAALTNLIQTDAPISPGDSGGALANASGQVIGITVAYEPPNQTGAVSIGFAIPAATAVAVADKLMSTSSTHGAYLGIGPVDVTPELQQYYGLSRSSGLLVTNVAAGSPAEQAGVKQGDIIVKIDGKDVTSSADLYLVDKARKPGDKLTLTIDRSGRELTIRAILGQWPASTQQGTDAA